MCVFSCQGSFRYMLMRACARECSSISVHLGSQGDITALTLFRREVAHVAHQKQALESRVGGGVERVAA